MMQSWDTNQVFRPQGLPPYPLLHAEEVKLTTSLSLQPPCHHHVGYRARHMYEISKVTYTLLPLPHCHLIYLLSSCAPVLILCPPLTLSLFCF